MTEQTTSSNPIDMARAGQTPDTVLQVDDHGGTGVFDAFHPRPTS